MASYLILTPPGKSANDEKARFIRDRFTGMAFVFPAIWLAMHRLWLLAAAAFAVQLVAAWLQADASLSLTGIALQLALSTLTALEGPAAIARNLERRGWTLRSVVSAEDLAMAEDIYFNDDETPAPAAQPVAPHGTARGSGSAGSSPAFGLIGYDGGR
jgi:hypothetical protein